jgi:7-cyano-7-deazaguanine synthase
MTKAQIAREGTRLGVDFAQTWNCYDPQPNARLPRGVGACGACDSCLLRQKGFQEAGLPDPTSYAQVG